MSRVQTATTGHEGVEGLGNAAWIAIVAFLGLLVGLALIDTRSDPTRRADRGGWHEPMGWALLVVAVLLVVLAAPTAAGNAVAPPQTPQPPGSSAPAPAPPAAAGPRGGGPP